MAISTVYASVSIQRVLFHGLTADLVYSLQEPLSPEQNLPVAIHYWSG